MAQKAGKEAVQLDALKLDLLEGGLEELDLMAVEMEEVVIQEQLAKVAEEDAMDQGGEVLKQCSMVQIFIQEQAEKAAKAQTRLANQELSLTNTRL
jgi:hypothetical protein